MCGIVGVARFGELNNIDLRNAALYFGTSLLEVTESRGKDATGLVSLFDNGNFFGQKMGIGATEFIARFGNKRDDFDGLLSVLREYKSGLRLLMGHCRKKSAGSLKNVDNHPIKVDNIIGIHNGTLKNQDIIFKNLDCKRDGEVDSEAIFRLLNHFTSGCKEPFTLDLLEEVMRRLEGSFSILAMNANNPNQLVSARDARPAEYCLIKPLKMIVIASEKKFIKQTIFDYNKLAYLHNVSGFQKLKAPDVEFATLKDDSIALFDLTHEITAATKIESLYETRDIPRAFNRIWKTETKTTNYMQNNYNRSTVKEKEDEEKKKQLSATNVNTTKDNTSKEDGKDDKNKPTGSVWNSSLNEYVRITDQSKKSEEAVVLSMEKKVKMSIEEAIHNNELDNSTEVITSTGSLIRSVTSVEKYMKVEKAKISNALIVDNSSVNDPVIIKKDTSIVRADLNNIKDGIKKGKGNSKDTIEALKYAIEAERDSDRFDNIYDVATAIGADANGLKQLSSATLANRICKGIYTRLFVTGWLAKCTQMHKNHSITENKLLKAQKHIRVLKKLNQFASDIHMQINSTLSVCTYSKIWTDEWIRAKVEESEVTEDTIKSIFNSWEIKTDVQLMRVIKTLQKKQ